MFIYNCAAVSRTGRRKNNEDNYLLGKFSAKLNHEDVEASCVSTSATPLIVAVADGMGGEASGELASFLAIKVLYNELKRFRGDLNSCRSELQKAIIKANDTIYDTAKKEDLHGMGSTIVTVVFLKSGMIYTNLGDSRLYMKRKGALRQLTKDHNEGQMLLDAGILNAEQLKKHRSNNILTRYLGIASDEVMFEVPLYDSFHLKNGDRFLICSDGISGSIDDSQLTNLLAMDELPIVLAKNIVDTAFENGCVDNMTAIVVDIEAV